MVQSKIYAIIGHAPFACLGCASSPVQPAANNPFVLLTDRYLITFFSRFMNAMLNDWNEVCVTKVRFGSAGLVEVGWAWLVRIF